MTTFVDASLDQQLEVIPPVINRDQLPSSWPSRRRPAGFPVALPEQSLVLPGMEMSAHYLPMKGVSGDYCDCLPLHGTRVGLAIGDACGKGIGAAFLMASLRAAFRTQVQICWEAGELLSRLNRLICHNTREHQFVTLIYGIWDADSCAFTYSGAGHPPALHYQAATGCVNQLKAGGMVLGVYEEEEYPAESVSLEAGDALILYTDGIIEATNAFDEVFGICRLSETVAAHGEKSAKELTMAILTAAAQFACRGWEDDVTLVVVKRVNA